VTIVLIIIVTIWFIIQKIILWIIIRILLPSNNNDCTNNRVASEKVHDLKIRLKRPLTSMQFFFGLSGKHLSQGSSYESPFAQVLKLF
jgi:hypothetical protein